MPVTAKLSRKFYEKLGEDLANELVDWFNAVDATYRADFRELNELNFARFDAKLEQRLAELEGKLTAEIGRLRDEMTAAIARAQSSTVIWMFGFWAPTAVAIAGTALGVVALLLRR
jgi:hypothetical protein